MSGRIINSNYGGCKISVKVLRGAYMYEDDDQVEDEEVRINDLRKKHTDSSENCGSL